MINIQGTYPSHTLEHVFLLQLSTTKSPHSPHITQTSGFTHLTHPTSHQLITQHPTNQPPSLPLFLRKNFSKILKNTIFLKKSPKIILPAEIIIDSFFSQKCFSQNFEVFSLKNSQGLFWGENSPSWGLQRQNWVCQVDSVLDCMTIIGEVH